MISWILGKISGPKLLVVILALLGANAAQFMLVKHNSNKVKLAKSQCLADAQAARAEGERQVREALSKAHEEAIAQKEAIAAAELKALQSKAKRAAELAAEELEQERRVSDALRDELGRDWAIGSLPNGLWFSTTGSDSTEGGDGS